MPISNCSSLSLYGMPLFSVQNFKTLKIIAVHQELIHSGLKLLSASCFIKHQPVKGPLEPAWKNLN